MSLIGAIDGVERGAADIIQRMAPSVVEIRSGFGVGAGIIWRADSLIVTNDHVARDDRVSVTFDDGRQTFGQVVARDQRNDLAIVQTSVHGLPAAIRRHQAVRAGELVLALGHPFWERYAAAVGIVATTATSKPSGRQLIQADVSIGSGSSGGPLVDANGFVIGINAMVGGGMALAVPGHHAEALIQSVISLAAA